MNTSWNTIREMQCQNMSPIQLECQHESSAHMLSAKYTFCHCKMIPIFYTFHLENTVAFESIILTLSQWGILFRWKNHFIKYAIEN